MLLFLIGYMGCGKSTIARKLVQRLGWKLIDTDHEIEMREGCSVAEIFEGKGEEYFRACERSLVEELAQEKESCVVSTGGGLPVWGDNMTLLNSVGQSVYIARTAENIASRLSPRGRHKRPKLRGLSDEELIAFMSAGIAQREPIYLNATLTLEAVPLSDDEIVARIVALIKNHC
ncbi:MAG: shikimate kinase [Rikenellaceae bacterium]